MGKGPELREHRVYYGRVKDHCAKKHICILEQQQLCFSVTSRLMANDSLAPSAVNCESANSALTT